MIDVDYLVIADAVAAAEGKHYIHGGGWDTLYGNVFPVTHATLAIAVRLRVPWNDTNQPHNIELDVINEDGASILNQALQAAVNVGRPPNVPPTHDQVVPLALSLLGVQFQQPGTYVVTFKINDELKVRSPFNVAVAPIPAEFQPAGMGDRSR